MNDTAPPRWSRLIDYIKRKLNERKTQRDKENAVDKAARITASGTRWIAWLTFILAALALYQFWVLRGQLDVMRKDQRAWIAPRTVGFQLAVGKPIVTAVRITNTGKTPGKGLNYDFRAQVLNASDPPTFDYSNKLLNVSGYENLTLPDPTGTTLGIGALQQISGTNTNEPTVLTQELSDKYVRRQIWVAVYGRMTYKDVFNTDHWMNVCFTRFNFSPGEFIASEPTGAEKCAKYNNTDNN